MHWGCDRRIRDVIRDGRSMRLAGRGHAARASLETHAAFRLKFRRKHACLWRLARQAACAGLRRAAGERTSSFILVGSSSGNSGGGGGDLKTVRD
jgi:hypothetical protein